jgi:hypothetical protein
MLSPVAVLQSSLYGMGLLVHRLGRNLALPIIHQAMKDAATTPIIQLLLRSTIAIAFVELLFILLHASIQYNGY